MFISMEIVFGSCPRKLVLKYLNTSEKGPFGRGLRSVVWITQLLQKIKTLNIWYYFLLFFKHDPGTKRCSPNENGGNYIMYTFSTCGREPNNYLFSECSKSQMWPIIFNKGPQCFIGKGHFY